MSPVALAVEIPEDQRACEVGAPCPGDLALRELKDEQKDRIQFDGEIATAVDKLSDACQVLQFETKGLHVATSNLDMAIAELKADVASVKTTVSKLANLRFWLVAILGAFEVLRTSGAKGLTDAVVEIAKGLL